MKKNIFIPPLCDLLEINTRGRGRGLHFRVLRNDGKIFNFIGLSFIYKNNLLNIKVLESLPIILNIKKEFIFNNTNIKLW